MSPRQTLAQVEAILTSAEIVASWRIVTADETMERAVYKIRCFLLRSTYQLEIRFIHTGEGIIYSYQLFQVRPLLRWDNAPHFPALSTFPHHLHDESGQATPSPLTGFPERDLPTVLSEVSAFLTRLD